MPTLDKKTVDELLAAHELRRAQYSATTALPHVHEQLERAQKKEETTRTAVEADPTSLKNITAHEKAKARVDALVESLGRESKALEVLAKADERAVEARTKFIAKTTAAGAAVVAFAAVVERTTEKFASLIDEQANYEIGLERVAQATVRAGVGFAENQRQLDAMRNSLSLTRKEMEGFLDSTREAFTGGMDPQAFAKMTEQLRRSRGAEQGLALSHQISQKLTAPEIRIAREGGQVEFEEKISTQRGDREKTRLMMEARRAAGLQGVGGAQAYTLAEAGSRSMIDQVYSALEKAAMPAATGVIEATLPEIAKSVQVIAGLMMAANVGRMATALTTAGTGMVAAGVTSAAGTTAGVAAPVAAGFLSRNFGKAAIGARLPRAATLLKGGGILSLAGMAAETGAQYVEDPTLKAGLTGVGMLSNVAGMAGMGAALGSAILPVGGTVVGGLAGAGLGAYQAYKQMYPTAPQGQPGASDTELAVSILERLAKQIQNIETVRTEALQGPAQERARGAEAMTGLAQAAGGTAGMQAIVEARRKGVEAETKVVEDAVKEWAKNDRKMEMDSLEALNNARNNAKLSAKEREAAEKSFSDVQLKIQEAAAMRGRVAIELYEKRLQQFTENITNQAQLVQKSAAFQIAGKGGEMIAATRDVARFQGMGPEQTREMGERMVQTKRAQLELMEQGRDEMSRNIARDRAAFVKKEQKSIEEDVKSGAATPEQAATRRAGVEPAANIAVAGAVADQWVAKEKVRLEMLQEEIRTISDTTDVYRRRLDVERAGITAQKEVAETLGMSYQQQFAIQQQLVQVDARELQLTRDQIKETISLGISNEQDSEKLQELRKKESQQAAQVFKESLGLQKGFLDKALGSMFGVATGSKFQPAITQRALYGEHSLFQGMVLRGQVSPEEQRRRMRGGILGGMAEPRGRLPGGGAPVPGAGAQPPNRQLDELGGAAEGLTKAFHDLEEALRQIHPPAALPPPVAQPPPSVPPPGPPPPVPPPKPSAPFGSSWLPKWLTDIWSSPEQRVWGQAEGGPVKGNEINRSVLFRPQGRDRIPVMAERDEFIVPADVARKHRKHLEWMRQGGSPFDSPSYMAVGGDVAESERRGRVHQATIGAQPGSELRRLRWTTYPEGSLQEMERRQRISVLSGEDVQTLGAPREKTPSPLSPPRPTVPLPPPVARPTIVGPHRPAPIARDSDEWTDADRVGDRGRRRFAREATAGAQVGSELYRLGRDTFPEGSGREAQRLQRIYEMTHETTGQDVRARVYRDAPRAAKEVSPVEEKMFQERTYGPAKLTPQPAPNPAMDKYVKDQEQRAFDARKGIEEIERRRESHEGKEAEYRRSPEGRRAAKDTAFIDAQLQKTRDETKALQEKSAEYDKLNERAQRRRVMANPERFLHGVDTSAATGDLDKGTPRPLTEADRGGFTDDQIARMADERTVGVPQAPTPTVAAPARKPWRVGGVSVADEKRLAAHRAARARHPAPGRRRAGPGHRATAGPPGAEHGPLRRPHQPTYAAVHERHHAEGADMPSLESLTHVGEDILGVHGPHPHPHAGIGFPPYRRAAYAAPRGRDREHRMRHGDDLFGHEARAPRERARPPQREEAPEAKKATAPLTGAGGAPGGAPPPTQVVIKIAADSKMFKAEVERIIEGQVASRKILPGGAAQGKV